MGVVVVRVRVMMVGVLAMVGVVVVGGEGDDGGGCW